MVCVVAVSGSHRLENHTRSTLGYTLIAVREAGARTKLRDLETVNLSLYHSDEKQQGDTAGPCRIVRD